MAKKGKLRTIIIISIILFVIISIAITIFFITKGQSLQTIIQQIFSIEQKSIESIKLGVEPIKHYVK